MWLKLLIARMIVNQVSMMIQNQLNILEQEIRPQLLGYIANDMIGVFEGRGANAFMSEINDILEMHNRPIIGDLGRLHGGINVALNTMDDADAEAKRIVVELGETFRQVI